MADTYLVWKILADEQVCKMVEELQTNCTDDSEWGYMMNQIMQWARPKLYEDTLFFIFEEIYNSNWEDAMHTTVQIIVENDLTLLVITSQAPGINWVQRIAEDFAKSLEKVLKDFKPY